MPDEREPHDAEYDWLYSAQPGAPADPPARSGSDELAETQLFGPPDQVTRPADQEPEPTRMFGNSPPPIPSEQAPQPAPPASFGGTYAAPERAGPRYAAPVPPPPRGASPPSSPPPRRPPSRRKRGNWWLRGFLILLFAWLVFLVAVPIWAWSKISKVDAEPGRRAALRYARLHLLLVGSDSRADLSAEQRQDLGTGAAAGQRTDTLLLLHVPAGDGPKVLLSIPRDSYVDIPGHGMNKINAAYSLGGPDLLVETIEQAMDLRVDNYLELGFSGFVEIVDAVGGIEVCPTEAVDDQKAGGLTLDQGCSEVDGRTALGYARSRDFALGDITRALHQREVITAIGQRAASWKTVVLPWRYFSINKAAVETLRVGEDVGPLDLARFGLAMARPGDDAKRCVVPYSDLGQSTDVGSVVIWDQARADALFTALREDDTSAVSCKVQ
ncbi:MAG: LCP family protein [Nocardioidaceae bacterium]